MNTPPVTRSVAAAMTPGRIAYLRRRYCRRQANYLWGQRRMIKPVLLPVQFGDGRQIIALRPVITRRDHYVVGGPAFHSQPCLIGLATPSTMTLN